ncbi:MAG: TonB-dependent receptor [Clostridium sp.]|nr:TonB-dependent receptor [Bacteroides sp.]MCM1197463.1 TonB-dependent receptor [Clostridium sp.]
MKKVKIFFTALLALVASAAFAQNITVKGTVVDASTGEPVPFAAIQVKGTATGATTDADGVYTISVDSHAVLVFSSIGYESKDVPVAGRTQVDCALSPDTQVLDETIVVAFGTSSKKTFTGSATVIKSEDIAKSQATDVTRAIEGVVPGVQMTTSSGALGSNPKIRIRGISSIMAGKEPLIVVDGAPYNGDLDNINSADIESMTVLKDAASSALYGARGANGIILITTKRAKQSNAVVSVDAKWGVNSRALKTYDYIKDPATYYENHYRGLYNYYVDKQGLSPLEASAKANTNVAGPANAGGLGYQIFNVPQGERFIGSNGKINPAATLGNVVNYNGQDYLITPDDWMEEAYHKSLRQEYNVSVAGTTGGVAIMASFGYLNNKGIVDGADMERYTARLKADYQAKKWLKVGANAAYSHFEYNNGNANEGSDGSTANIFSFTSSMPPIYPLYIRDGEGNILYDAQGWKRYDWGNGDNAGMTRSNGLNSNALQLATLDRNNTNGNSFNGNGYAEVTFLKDFKFTFNASVGLQEYRSTSMKNMYYGQFAPTGGTLSKGHNRNLSLNMQEILTYHKVLGKHDISVMLAHENSSSTTVSVSASKSNLFSHDTDEFGGAIIDGQSAYSSKSEYNNEGYLAQASYGYDNRYFVSASYRRDASSYFHPDNRWGNFWSVGAGWLINNESWFKASWVDMLKLKASIGSVGNDGIGSYRYVDTYSISNSDGNIAVAFNTKGNKDISWETITNLNVGTEFDFFRGRLAGSVEYFYRKTSDMLFFFSVPSSLGYDGYYDNIGDMRNSGVEISLNGTLIRTKNFTWDMNLNATHYTNKIIRLPEENKKKTIEGYEGYESGNYFYAEGLPIYNWLIPHYAGVNQENGMAMWYKDVVKEDADGNEYTVRETTTTYSEATDYLSGSATPKLYGGFGTSLNFYGFDVAVQFTYSIGGLAYDSGYASLVASPGAIATNVHVDVLKAWTPENHTDFPRYQYQDTNFNSLSDRFLVDASYLNFQNAQIGYTLPRKFTEKIRISKIRIYCSADNIVYWSRRNGLDTRYDFDGSTNSNMHSPVRTVSGGINITF